MTSIEHRFPQPEPAKFDPWAYDAFVVILLPPEPDGSLPGPEAYYTHSDPFHACFNWDCCGCPPAPPNQRWTVWWFQPGDRFDGRLAAGISVPTSRRGNLLRARDVPRPFSCYAIITPDGLWHECFEAEKRDLILVDDPDETMPAEQDTITKLQVAWRYEVDRLLTEHGDCWALGCTAELAVGVRPRQCDLQRLSDLSENGLLPSDSSEEG
jgi:hypothetical protein